MYKLYQYIFFSLRIAKRVSLILVGEPAACECGPSGQELNRHNHLYIQIIGDRKQTLA